RPLLHTTPSPPHTYTLSLHDALPISPGGDQQMRAGDCLGAAVHRERQCDPPVLLFHAAGLGCEDEADSFAFEDLLHLVGNVVVLDRKSTRLKSSHVAISYAVFCLKKK